MFALGYINVKMDCHINRTEDDVYFRDIVHGYCWTLTLMLLWNAEVILFPQQSVSFKFVHIWSNVRFLGVYIYIYDYIRGPLYCMQCYYTYNLHSNSVNTFHLLVYVYAIWAFSAKCMHWTKDRCICIPLPFGYSHENLFVWGYCYVILTVGLSIKWFLQSVCYFMKQVSPCLFNLIVPVVLNNINADYLTFEFVIFDYIWFIMLILLSTNMHINLLFKNSMNAIEHDKCHTFYYFGVCFIHHMLLA